ncbi:PREDICTED: terminal uridylyltransferase 7-like isoform X2 [Elephantulus edwardii]|uniref:terminal uridylyltransferase 7-like isoform X2 n=1 Tax=Elephantulus edwardii TaxID=28737 RepID=UPI0003F0E7AD|nr:PREDICTED: terminal uridylyltransferase 7-like isoform X2 [Elephantulus edwardii]
MGDAAKPYFLKRAKERGTIDDDDFRRGHLQQDYLIMEDYVKGHNGKMEKGLLKKKVPPGHYGNIPRKGPYAVSNNPYAFKNPIYSQPAWINDNHKDQNKRWLSDELSGNTDNWREFKPGPRSSVISRVKKDSFQESEDGYRWQDGRGGRTVRRVFHKELTSVETVSEMEAGSPENKKQRSRPKKPRRSRNDENEQDEDLEGPVIDEAVLSVKELLGLQQAEERLKKDCIERLERRPRNYPTAKYTCKLCDVLIESIAFAHKHIKEKRHKKNVKEKEEEELLTTLPLPTPSQINAVDLAINKVVKEFGLHPENLEQRLGIKHIMENVFRHKLPDCSLRLYGSSCSLFGFRNSDVNIDIQFPITIEGFSLNKLGNFNLKEVKKDSVVWEYTDAATENADPVAEEVARELRESPVKKGQAPLTLDFRHQPSVPVGQLWVELLRFYALEFSLADLVINIRVKESVTRELKDWPKKRIAIEDPYSVKRNVARTLNNQLVFEYILHCLRTTYKYFALPHKITKSSLLKLGDSTAGISEYSKEVINNDPAVQAKDDKLKSSVLARDPGAISPSANTHKGQPLPLKQTTDLFGAPPAEEIRNVHISVNLENSHYSKTEASCDSSQDVSMHCQETGGEDENLKIGSEGQHHLAAHNENLNSSKHGELSVCGGTHYEADRTLDLEHFRNLTVQGREGFVTIVVQANIDEESIEGNHDLDDSLYHFTPSIRSHTLEVIHSDEEEEDEEHRVTVNQREDEDGIAHEEELDNTYTGSGEEDALSEDDEELDESAKNEDLKECEKHAARTLLGELNKISLKEETVFGEYSTEDQSDLFYEFSKLLFTKGKGLDCVRTIEDLARFLRKHSGLRNILPITTAKVPIVKFIHSRSGLEVDISLYNTLALHNTRLLAAYSAIDPRVKYLCYTMKVFTKMCDIGDASRGSLSSYAYTLMVLYFLQQRNPPVIPVLQEIYRDETKPEILVDGWNTYFFDQIDELPTFWPEYGKNTESVGQLWLGLLRFYTEEFDFKEHVISIRRKSLLTTFKKQWTSKYIVIEDPFDLNHNLGAGLSRKMTNFIMKAFINGRRVFGSPVKGFPKDYPSKMEYFFDPDVLTEGELAPNDRCCRICGKIGHFMKDCPMRRKVRRRRDQEDTPNQRYPEGKEKRSKEDKDIQKKYTEKEISAKEDKSLQRTSQKAKPSRAAADLGREKLLRPPVDKWKRQDDRDSLRDKRCFICGREGHIKKECPQFKGSPGSLSSKYMTQGKASPKRTHQES